jgi:redox-sensitive bicupin YhaK (pirin superfamily)
LQIWVFPNKKNVAPRYDQQTFADATLHNKLVTVVSPVGDAEGVHVHQDAWFSLGHLEGGTELSYNLKKKGNGVYAFVLEGDVFINDIFLNRRDGLGISDTEHLTIKSDSSTKLLLMEVPMN